MTYTELRYETDGDVGVITLDRPEARNALTHTTYATVDDVAAFIEKREPRFTGR